VRLLPGLRRALAFQTQAHQGGWDEVLLFFGAPVTLFVLLRWLGLRKERREQAEKDASGSD
jgi:hypothetical protein